MIKSEKISFRTTSKNKNSLLLLSEDYGVSISYLINIGIEIIINKLNN